MKYRHIKIKKGQIWERKKDGVRIIILHGKGDAWETRIVGNLRKTHHTLRFDLYKYWKNID